LIYFGDKQMGFEGEGVCGLFMNGMKMKEED